MPVSLASFSPILLTGGGRLPAEPARWALQPKWDGVRVLFGVDGGTVQWRSRQGTDLSGLAPAADGDLRRLPSGMVLDGELIWPVERDGSVVQHFGAVRDARHRTTP